ncbi:MAG TPA: methyltransferase type 11 [Rhodospirillaceae bacterium]|nr:methyltransferase type 11 [Rhodospirillaceae bacterium]HAA93604.1 methyltransferase type 11 [Rhodospirillaceae bacterium]HAT35058.1 methyltransferase type 11 [Rhodospirillaceae bacterium]
MTEGEKQLSAWSGDFGRDYVSRNQATAEAIEQRRLAFEKIFESFYDGENPQSILETGCNIGINIHALSQLTDATLHAIEPNRDALDTLIDSGILPPERALQGSLQSLPFEDGEIDLVFTSGVLIHIPDEALDRAIAEIYRVSARYILTLEYFSPKPQAIPYHGQDDFLFKRDYGGIFLDAHPDLEYVADGFFWKRTTGLDDLNWWLFRKPEA